MKKLDATKLTDEQIEFFKTHLAYLSTVDKNGEPQIGPKQSMKVLDNGHLQYLEKTKAHAYENLKNGSKAAVVVADWAGRPPGGPASAAAAARRA